jgi:hypothetical protein
MVGHQNGSLAVGQKRRRADLLLQCTVLNSKFGSGFGQMFGAETDRVADLAMAA